MKITAKLGSLYYLCVVFLSMIWGLGIILHFVNNRVFPHVLDDEGITTRNGKRHLWKDLESWDRNRLSLGAKGGPRIAGNLTLRFKTGKVVIATVLANLDEVLAFVSKKIGFSAKTG